MVGPGEALVCDLLRDGCVTVCTIDADGEDVARTRLFLGGDVINFVRPDVIGTKQWDRHLAAVVSHVRALARAEARLAGLTRRLVGARGVLLVVVVAFASLAGGLVEAATALWTVLAAGLGWGVARGGSRILARWAAQRLARRLFDEPG